MKHRTAIGLAALVGSSLVALPAPAASPESFVTTFRSICWDEFGDLDRIRNAARARRLEETRLDGDFAESLLASRDGLSVVYRGAPTDPPIPIPQCSVQMPHGAPADYPAIADRVRLELELGPGQTETDPDRRRTKWIGRDAAGTELAIMLTGDLVGDEMHMMLVMARRADWESTE